MISLHLNWGGLGDSLQFSTLPEEFLKQKNETFYLSNTCKDVFRNTEIFDLVWGNNPYFKGFTNHPPNAGHVLGWTYNYHPNMISNIEIAHGIIATNRFPKIYNNFKKMNEMQVIIDLTSTSLKKEYLQKKDDLLKKINELTSHIDKSNIAVIQFDEYINKNILDIPDLKKIKISSIYEYANTIFSCERFIGLTSGGAVLTSTIKDKTIKSMDVIELYEHNWKFDNATYHRI